MRPQQGTKKGVINMAVLVREKVKGSGEWWVFINHKGKRRSKKVGDKKAANAVKREVEQRLAKGELGLLKEKKPTLAVFGEKCVNDPDQQWATNTRRLYGLLFKNHIEPHPLAGMPLDEIVMHHVKDFIGDLNGKNLSKKTISVVLAFLHGIFEAARVYEHVSVNPCARTGKFITGNGSRSNSSGINCYDAEEAATLIERSKSLGLMSHTLFTFLIRTGVRIGEALGLNWGDINFEDRTATISKSWDYRNRELGPTKTRSIREIDLSPYTVQVLKRLRLQTKFNRDGDPIFCTDKGQRLSDHLIRSQFYKIRLRENITLQGLRHTYATLRIAKGDNIVDVSAQLGHKKVSMTLDIYTEWLPRHHKGQVDELDSLHLSAPYTQPENKSLGNTVH